MVCVADGVDGEVVDDTAGGHIRVSLRVNVGVTFPRLPGPELYRHTQTHTQRLAVFNANIFLVFVFLYVKAGVPGGQVTVFPWGGGELARGGQPSPTEPIDWPGGLRGDGPGDRKS